MEVGKPKGAIAGKGPEFFSLPAKPQAMLFDLLRLQAFTTMLRSRSCRERNFSIVSE
jgi:hypothetical protein